MGAGLGVCVDVPVGCVGVGAWEGMSGWEAVEEVRVQTWKMLDSTIAHAMCFLTEGHER